MREDSLTLFGFADDDERAGLRDRSRPSPASGPRLAQALLARAPPDSLRRAVADDDVTALTRVSGRRAARAPSASCSSSRTGSAPRPAPTLGGAPAARHDGPAWQGQVHAALVGLGWSTREADAAVGAVAEEVAPDADVATVLRAALRSLDRA